MRRKDFLRFSASTAFGAALINSPWHFSARRTGAEAAEASFRILIQKVLKEHKPFFDLEGFRVIVEKRGKNEPCLSEATIKVRVNDTVEQTAAEGDGPINALDSALRKALGAFYPQLDAVHLVDYKVRILDSLEATGAQTRVIIESSNGALEWSTMGSGTNIIAASCQALCDSLEYAIWKTGAEVVRRDERHFTKASTKTAPAAGSAHSE